MKTRFYSFAAIMILALLSFGCEIVEDEGALITEYDETAFAENLETQLADDIDEAVFLSSGSASGRFGDGHFGGYGMIGCVTRTVEKPEEGDYPMIITLEFDAECDFGNVTKSGTIIITLTGPRNEEGSQLIVEFVDFYVNGILIEGTRIHDFLGNGECTMTMADGKFTNEEGQVMTRNVYRHRIRVEGGDTEDIGDDVFEIEGNAEGLNFEGYTYTKTITKALRKTRECRWIISGTIVTESEGGINCTLDFGDGECDNLATRTVEGEDPEEIEMNGRLHKFQYMSKNRHKNQHKNN